MRKLYGLAGILLIGTAPMTTSPLPVHVGGRVVPQVDGSLLFGWPGTYFEGRFRGPAIRVRFDAPAEHVRVLVDGAEKAVFENSGSVDVVLGDLPPGDHVVRLDKMTESQTGGGRFVGFFPAAGSQALPAPPARRRQIEFVGDSYTVGYGNTAPGQVCTEQQVHDTTDTQQAFGPLVARHLDADFRINAYSGYGMIRNYNGTSPGQSLPAIYHRLKPDDAAHVDGDRGDWRPGIIVVNLGTNDFSTPLHAGEPWKDQAAFRAAYRQRYVEFVSQLHRRQPQARFVLMGSDLFFPEVQQVATMLGKVIREPIVTVEFGGLAYSGCNAHPSTADDKRIAATLEKAIDAAGL